MLVHLSTTSPYICDTSLGPIEQADRMASAPTKQTVPFLDYKESFPKSQQTRTPLKLLAPDEVPMNTSVATNTTTTTDINNSRQQSLQPVWYTEQSIVDDANEQRNSIKSPNHRSTLPTIESNSPEIEKESFSTRPSLMRKSSTFTIEQIPSVNVSSALNESEKENDLNVIMTSTQKEIKDPSDESFRRLEQLLGLGSANTNLTMTTANHESPKSNHESLSLTIVTPTELINQTTASLHLSYAPAGGGSLPSSQNILLMQTIESITEPSMNSTMPPPFAVDNSDMEEPSSAGGTVINPDISKCTEDSYHFTDDDEERLETPKDDSNTEEDSNFSFELNDFPNTTTERTPPPPPQPPMITIRAPTSADVAYRALVKPRAGGRISQPVKNTSPLAEKKKTRLSVPAPPTRVLRSSSRPITMETASENTTVQEVNESNSIPDEECFVNENKTENEAPPVELVEVVSVPEEDDIEEEQPAAGITLNLTETKEIINTSPTSAEEADCSASSSASYISNQQDICTPTNAKQPVLSREYSYNTPTSRSTRTSQRRSIVINRQSYLRPTHSSIPSIPEQHASISEEEQDLSICSIPSSSKTMLSSLSTNPTIISEAPPIILRKSLAGSASPSPNPTPVITIRPSERLSSISSPRRNINPLHSSTPSVRNKSLQMISIGEQEQLSTTVPPQLNIDITADDVEMLDNEQQVDIPIEIQHVNDEGIQTSPIQPPRRIDISVQTTPSLDPLSRRRFHTIEQQTTPIATRTSSSSTSQTTSIPITHQQTSPMILTSSKTIIEEKEYQQQVTPLHSKAIMHLRRNVRFQFTPSTDARLAAKEKLEDEEQKRPKLDIVVNTPVPTIPSDNEREEDTEDEIQKTKKKIPSSKKKKIVPIIQSDDSSEEMQESPVRRTTRHQPPKDEPLPPPPTTTNEVAITSITHPKKKMSKRSARNEKKSSPIKEEPAPQPDIVVTTTSPPQPTKRAYRKRPNPKTSTTSPPEQTTSPTEPATKRAKTAKNLEVKQPTRVPSPEPPSTRGRSKTPIISSENIKSTSPSEPVDRPPVPTSKKSKKTSLESESVPTNNKRKSAMSAGKKGKRRLHSVEQDEGLNTADEEETIAPSIEIKSTDLSPEEREKIEGLTVAELKTRLTAHNEIIPKGVRKADLVALLIKIETNLLQAQKHVEVPPAASDTTSRKTRRKK